MQLCESYSPISKALGSYCDHCLDPKKLIDNRTCQIAIAQGKCERDGEETHFRGFSGLLEITRVFLHLYGVISPDE